MITVKRYNPDAAMSISREHAWMRETPEGGHVEYGDYASLFAQFESVKAERDAQQKRADALAVENESLFSAAGEVYAAGYNHGHLNTVDGIAYTEGVEESFAEIGAQVLFESSETPATSAALAAIQAQGVEKFAAYLWKRGNEIVSEGGKKSEVIQVRVAAKMAEMFAKELREAK
ncbi:MULTISPECIES: hypothetical protein [Serratia]|uniref:hypothetical protein n=1 Tax=Serratia TaxID=613 RepID=UPI0028130344|nr:hypothetical protein [Serratia marcescens]MDQ9391208.1 hypothetical protein [Serratia marcescens]MDQ9499822.1 hypothetical protein [Serratia marcescens]MDQ9510662.1 hypothetical protein [Serratia marcescens]MDQ9512046.1 hypothetical protein [Serratia marcescens]MDQ9546719.1 hypothetical protein [Serratia marcescens]